MRDYSEMLRENAFSHIRNRNAAITYSYELRFSSVNITPDSPFDRPAVKLTYRGIAMNDRATRITLHTESLYRHMDSDSRSFSMDFEVIAPSFSH